MRNVPTVTQPTPAVESAVALPQARRGAWSLLAPSSLLRRHWKIALILLLAALLRLNHFRQPLYDAFSWRQASTAMMAWNFYHDDWNVFFPAVNWNGPEPAYTGREFQTVTFLAAIVYNIFGPDDWIGRAISATFGVWGVFAFFRLTRRVWDEPRAYAGALMLAVMPGVVFIDRSFLPDPAMLALTTTTLWVYVTYLQTARRQYLALAGALGVIAFLTKLPGVITLVPMAYATVAILRQQGRLNWPSLRPIAGTLLIALVPVGAYYWWAVYLGTHYPPYHVAGASNWVNLRKLPDWISQAYFLPKNTGHFTRWLWTMPVIGLALLGGLFSPRRAATSASGDVADHQAHDEAEPKAPWLFHFWAVGCVVLYLIGAKELADNPWNLHVFNPVGAALAGQGLVLLLAGRTIWREPLATRAALTTTAASRAGAFIRLALILIVVLLQTRSVFRLMTRGYAVDSVHLGRALEKLSKQGDTVVMIGDAVGDPIGIYYSRRRGWVFPPADRRDVWGSWGMFPPDDRVSIRMFEDIRAAGADWLGIVANPKDQTPGRREFWKYHPQFVDHVNRTCELVQKTRQYTIYRIRAPQELAQLPAAAAAMQPTSSEARPAAAE